MNTTGTELINHWDWAAEKGLMNRNTAGSLRAACSQILAVQDNWESLDISSIDVNEYIRRFQNLRAKDFSPASLETYAKRFRKAVQLFVQYAKDPAAWKPPSRSPRNPDGRGKSKNEPKKTQADQSNFPGDSSPPIQASRGLIDYPFPLRENLVARLMLPRDITPAEVKRLHGFMTALVEES